MYSVGKTGTKKRWDVLNEMDYSWQVLTEKQMFDDSKTNIGTAINAGMFYYCK